MAVTPSGWLEPMLARSGRSTPPSGPGWVYERKLDGIRVVAARRRGGVELWSRNHLPLDSRFPGVARAIGAVGADDFVVDGEVVAWDGTRTSFGLLQRSPPGTRIVLCVFDLLQLLGSDIRTLPLLERKRLLAQLLGGAGPGIELVAPAEGDGAVLLDAACRSGWEGLVAKRADSPYRAGRSPDWRKLKCQAGQELVVGGWTEPNGTRTGFGALAVGYHDGTGLRYAGRVGTGFDERDLRTLYAMLTERQRPDPPFVDPPRESRLHWVRPDLVVQVAFTEWTSDGRLRHPAFEGLRIDKDAALVERES